MNTDWLPLERTIGPLLYVDFMFMGRSEQIHLYSTERPDAISTLLRMGLAFATRLRAISQSGARRRSSTFSIEGALKLHAGMTRA